MSNWSSNYIIIRKGSLGKRKGCSVDHSIETAVGLRAPKRTAQK